MTIDRNDPDPPMELELRAARIPVIGRIAHHYWLVILDGEPERWEIWQWRDAGGESWGHLHRNLLPYDQGVGAGPSWVVRRWSGELAAELTTRLTQAPRSYPWRDRYLPWPGPNSNTFVRWVIGDARLMGWQAFGKHYPVWRRRRRSSPRAAG